MVLAKAAIDVALAAAVRGEIENLHNFFVSWFSGSTERGRPVLEAGLLDRFDESFLLIPPAGVVRDRSTFAESVEAAYGTNPDFKVAIRNVTVRRRWDEHVLATYEEWQRNALASKPPDNGRLATVLFRQDQGLRWLHVHETWLPRSVMEAGPYDF